MLDLLSAEEAVAFLSNRTGQSDLQAASELAGRSGDFLALEQAAAYIEETGTSLAPRTCSCSGHQAGSFSGVRSSGTR